MTLTHTKLRKSFDDYIGETVFVQFTTGVPGGTYTLMGADQYGLWLQGDNNEITLNPWPTIGRVRLQAAGATQAA